MTGCLVLTANSRVVEPITCLLYKFSFVNHLVEF